MLPVAASPKEGIRTVVGPLTLSIMYRWLRKTTYFNPKFIIGRIRQLSKMISWFEEN